ncbi:MAG: FmdB family zinc ribbon protein [Luteimonas sp.]
MPIYAYRCTACAHDFDRLQKLSDPDPETCPHCAAATVTRQLTAPSFRLAGSGWYETDFKKDSDKKRNLVETADTTGKHNGGSADGAVKSADGTAAAVKPADSKPAQTPPGTSTNAGATPKAVPEAKPAAKPASSDA